MNNEVFGKTMENVRRHKDIRLVSTERRKYLVSELNYHTTKLFRENLLPTEIKKADMFVKKPVYLGLSILELSKILMYELWYDYVKSIYGEKANCVICIQIIHLKTDGIYKNIAEDVETRFVT